MSSAIGPFLQKGLTMTQLLAKLRTVSDAGAPGYEGQTLVTAGPGGHVAALTLTGWAGWALDYWGMKLHFGHDPVSDSDFLLIRYG